MQIQLKQTSLGEAVKETQFKSFSVQRGPDGQYSVTVEYVERVTAGGVVISETSALNTIIDDASVREHPLFPQLYPGIQEFTRAVLATARPDLVE